jgi:hypothetical protein
MAQVIRTDTTGKQLIRVRGRVIFETTASNIEYMPENKREIVNLIATSSGGVARSFTIDANGYLLINDTVGYTITEVSPEYKEFQFKNHQ